MTLLSFPSHQVAASEKKRRMSAKKFIISQLNETTRLYQDEALSFNFNGKINFYCFNRLGSVRCRLLQLTKLFYWNFHWI